VTAGTGSHAYGRRNDGLTAVAGGRGYYLGDEGGAYNIAQQAFRAVYQADDGRSAETALTALIQAHFQCQDLEQLLFKIYANTYSRDQLAQVSKLVGQAATEGDPVAQRILADAGDELGKAVAAVLRSLEQIDSPFPVAPNGSVFNASRFITEPMMTRVQATNPQAYLTEARFSPAIGAVLLALLNGGFTINERILRNLEFTKGKTFQKDTMRKKS
jgi:N-acetylglucosamine kinase-like BadF-type ATPase